MRKLLNTLYVTTPDAYLSKDGLNVVVSVNQKEVFRIPAINIEGIVTFGYMGASPGVMRLCSENGISLTFLSPHGRFVSRVQGAIHGNVLLRKSQYALSDGRCMFPNSLLQARFRTTEAFYADMPETMGNRRRLMRLFECWMPISIMCFKQGTKRS